MDKNVKSLLASNIMGFAHCTDGTMAMWGLLNASTVPVLFPANGSLTGKTIRSIERGAGHYFAICTDGTMSAWGYNDYGLLGNGSQNLSKTPILVSMQALQKWRTFHRLYVEHHPQHGARGLPLQTAVTLPATAITGTSATLRGSVHCLNNNPVSLRFEFGLDTTYGSTLAATPRFRIRYSRRLSERDCVRPHSRHHLSLPARCQWRARGHPWSGHDIHHAQRQCPSRRIGLETGILSPAFDRNQTSYIATVSHETETIRLAPLAEHPGASVTVNGKLRKQ